MIRTHRQLALAGLLAFVGPIACSSDNEDSSTEGDGDMGGSSASAACTVTANDDGSATIDCPDGTSETVTPEESAPGDGDGDGDRGGAGGAGGPTSTITCGDLPQCDEAGVSCDGDDLVTCVELFPGCLAEARTDCSVQPEGTCGNVGDVASCVLPEDSPCEGKTLCTELGNVSCAVDGSAIETCAYDADGCLVATPETCELGTTCEDNVCVAACEDSNLCSQGPGTHCAEDGGLIDCRDATGDGCLNALVDSCDTGEFCTETVGDAACSTATESSCASPTAISGLGSWNFRGEDTLLLGDFGALTGAGCDDIASRVEFVVAADLSAGQTLSIAENDSSASFTTSIQTGTCGSGTCVATGDDAESATYTASGTETVYGIAQRDFSSSQSFDIRVMISECGDGIVTAPIETCDDMNDIADDGCTECQVDPITYGQGETLEPFDLNGLVRNGDATFEVVFSEDVTLVGTVNDPTADLDLEILDENRNRVANYIAIGAEAVQAKLPAGTYFFEVSAFSADPTDPVVSLHTASSSCGNGISGNGEECDDANALAGDGCNLCEQEDDWICGGSFLDPSTCRNYDSSWDKAEDDGLPIDSSTPAVFDLFFASSCTIEDILVRTDINHDARGDLEIRIQSPAGTWGTLATASVLVTGEDYDGVFGLDYAPLSDLTTIFDGEQANGVWTLEITDDGDQGSGSIFDWEVYAFCQ